MTPPTLSFALSAHAAGLVPVPMLLEERDGSWHKEPTCSTWGGAVTVNDIETWYQQGSRANAVAVQSGRILCIDIDSPELCNEVITGVSFLLDAFVASRFYLQQTPSGGCHMAFAVADPERYRNEKLAMTADSPPKTLIETRASGGLFLVHPSPHYKVLQGDLLTVPVLGAEDVDAILYLCRTYDQRRAEENKRQEQERRPEPKPYQDGDHPGDWYDKSGNIFADLRSAGWVANRDHTLWRRPGKSKGFSMTWDRCGLRDRFFCFSTNAGLPTEEVLRPWHVYAWLFFAGDYKVAAREIARHMPRIEKPIEYGPSPEWLAANPDFAAAMVTPPAPQNDQEAAKAAVAAALLAVDDEPLPAKGIAPATTTVMTPDQEELLWQKLEATRVDNLNTEPELNPILFFQGRLVLSEGNITMLTGQSKSGKTQAISAILSAALWSIPDERLRLGFSAPRNNDGMVLHFDCEQSKHHAFHVAKRVGRRSGAFSDDDPLPSNFRDYHLTAWEPNMVVMALGVMMRRFSEQGRIRLVSLDGGADLLTTLNDEETSNALTRKLMSLAAEYSCGILVAVHENEQSQSGKARGHLGSQLSRKMEAEIKVKRSKQEGASIIYVPIGRNGDVPESKGVSMVWDDNLSMMVGQAAGEIKDQEAERKRLELRGEAIEVSHHCQGRDMTYGEIKDAIKQVMCHPESTAKRRIKEWTEAGLLVYDLATKTRRFAV
jgi:hypothetical protein